MTNRFFLISCAALLVFPALILCTGTAAAAPLLELLTFHPPSSSTPTPSAPSPICSWEQQIDKTLQRLSQHHLPTRLNTSSIMECAENGVRSEALRLSVYVVESSVPNAWVMKRAGHRILISRVLLEQIADESELAFVLAHELAHLRLGHTPAVPQNLLLTQAQTAHINDIKRSWELEADREAVRLMVCSGYNPDAAISLLQRLDAPHNSVTSLASGSHIHLPVHDRARYLRSLLACRPGECSPQFRVSAAAGRHELS